MKTSLTLVAALVACARAAPTMNILAVVTKDCTQTPTPQSMSGDSRIFPATTLQECQQRCVTTNCVGFSWEAKPSMCTAFNWISTSFDTTDPVSSWRCRAQVPQENGQLVGLDFAKVSVPSADQCSYKCEATQGCFAYSWSGASGGSCSLKSDKPSTLTGPYDGSVVSGEVYKCGRPYTSANIEGSDLASAPAEKWSDCCAVCRRTNGCGGFSWSGYNGGTCWLKGKVSLKQLTYTVDVVSALMLGDAPTSGPDKCTETDTSLVFAGPSEAYNGYTYADCREICLTIDCVAFSFNDYTCTLWTWSGMAVNAFGGRSWRCRHQLPQENGYYAGLGLDNAPTKDADKCSYLCDETRGCWAYSWTKANNGTCWMKTNKPLTISEPFDGSAVSGEVYKCTSPQYDVDVVGDDLASLQRAGWSDCCGACRRTTGCDAFSWSNYNGGTCWLKTKTTRGKTKAAPGVVSGYMIPAPSFLAGCTPVQEEFQGEIRADFVDQAEDCAKLCVFYNCAGFQWDISTKYTCRIFLWITSATAVAPTTGAYSNYRCRVQLPQENGDYAGLDLANAPAANAAMCSYKCEETAGCYGYSWSGYNGGTCYMKTGRPSSLSGPTDGSVVSGEPLKCQRPVNGQDIVGADVGSAMRSSWPECVGVCRRTGGCKAFTWSSYNGGTC